MAEQGRQGFRALAVATRPVDAQPDYTRDDERDLTLAGFLLFADPPKPGIGAMIARLLGLGVDVKIITGDNELLTRKICSDIGLDRKSVV